MMSWNDRMPASHQKLKQQTRISSKDTNNSFALGNESMCYTGKKTYRWKYMRTQLAGEQTCFSGVLKCYQAKQTIWNTMVKEHTKFWMVQQVK